MVHTGPINAGKNAPKRFQTTTATGLEAIVARRGELESRQVIAKRLNERKIANTKTSIVFGFDNEKMETDAQRRQKDILQAEKRDIAAEKKHMHDLKMHLKFHTNISFGDEPVDYVQDSKLADPTGELHKYTGVLNKDVERFIKQSNLYFGNDKPIYESIAHSGTKGILKAEQRDIAKERKEMHEKKMHLKFHTNIDFGDDEHDWSTDYRRGFKKYSQEECDSVRGNLAQEVKADLRKCHFEFGHDKPEWETDVMRSHWKIADKIMSENGSRDIAREKKEMHDKKMHLKFHTNIDFGNDPDYM